MTEVALARLQKHSRQSADGIRILMGMGLADVGKTLRLRSKIDVGVGIAVGIEIG